MQRKAPAFSFYYAIAICALQKTIKTLPSCADLRLLTHHRAIADFTVVKEVQGPPPIDGEFNDCFTRPLGSKSFLVIKSI